MAGLLDVHRKPVGAPVALTPAEREASARALGEYAVKATSYVRLNEKDGDQIAADRWRLELAAIQGAAEKIGPAPVREECVTP